jgi:A/G-specific adenine glycosylase
MDAGALLDWYAREGRDLPWRRTRDPYRVLVSEVMLQQTQVDRVIPRYERFLARFPDERSLAAASAADVIEEWSGLGYNRRALALRRAAQAVAEHGWPRALDGLQALPGVGPYTAAAVASFAFDAQVAAVDTNLRRVIERRDGVVRPPGPLARRAAELVPGGRAAAWNHAMMDLGATICRPRAPRCDACPVAEGCATRGVVAAAERRPRERVRFEETDRFARGRVVAALVERRPLPHELGEERLARALAGLERDGLIVREGERVALPGR